MRTANATTTARGPAARIAAIAYVLQMTISLFAHTIIIVIIIIIVVVVFRKKYSKTIKGK
jgi:t-SNARE complex subunit (syntaxin)